jgi:hypothetical protein
MFHLRLGNKVKINKQKFATLVDGQVKKYISEGDRLRKNDIEMALTNMAIAVAIKELAASLLACIEEE